MKSYKKSSSKMVDEDPLITLDDQNVPLKKRASSCHGSSRSKLRSTKNSSDEERAIKSSSSHGLSTTGHAAKQRFSGSGHLVKLTSSTSKTKYGSKGNLCASSSEDDDDDGISFAGDEEDNEEEIVNEIIDGNKSKRDSHNTLSHPTLADHEIASVTAQRVIEIRDPQNEEKEMEPGEEGVAKRRGINQDLSRSLSNGKQRFVMAGHRVVRSLRYGSMRDLKAFEDSDNDDESFAGDDDLKASTNSIINGQKGKRASRCNSFTRPQSNVPPLVVQTRQEVDPPKEETEGQQRSVAKQRFFTAGQLVAKLTKSSSVCGNMIELNDSSDEEDAPAIDHDRQSHSGNDDEDKKDVIIDAISNVNKKVRRARRARSITSGVPQQTQAHAQEAGSAMRRTRSFSKSRTRSDSRSNFVWAVKESSTTQEELPKRTRSNQELRWPSKSRPITDSTSNFEWTVEACSTTSTPQEQRQQQQQERSQESVVAIQKSSEEDKTFPHTIPLSCPSWKTASTEYYVEAVRVKAGKSNESKAFLQLSFVLPARAA